MGALAGRCASWVGGAGELKDRGIAAAVRETHVTPEPDLYSSYDVVLEADVGVSFVPFLDRNRDTQRAGWCGGGREGGGGGGGVDGGGRVGGGAWM